MSTTDNKISKKIDFLKGTDHFFLFVNIKIFLKKLFSWTWFSVKDAQGKDTDQMFRIDSIATSILLTEEEILEANDHGKLFQAIEAKLKKSELPKIPDVQKLMEKKAEVVTRLKLDLDESSQESLIQTLATAFNNSRIEYADLGVIFTAYAMDRFKDKEIASDWMKATFGEPFHQSKNEFKFTIISFLKGLSAREFVRNAIAKDLDQLV